MLYNLSITLVFFKLTRPIIVTVSISVSMLTRCSVTILLCYNITMTNLRNLVEEISLAQLQVFISPFLLDLSCPVLKCVACLGYSKFKATAGRWSVKVISCLLMLFFFFQDRKGGLLFKHTAI